jgi:hypothetical protein
MRHDDTDEANAAAHGDRSAGCRRACDDRDVLEALHRDAQVIGRGFAERQAIEPAGEKAGGKERDDDDRSRCHYLLPVRTCQRAQAPEGDVTQLRIAGDIDQHAGQCARQGRHSNAGEQHGGDLGLAAYRRYPVKQQGRCEPSGKG